MAVRETTREMSAASAVQEERSLGEVLRQTTLVQQVMQAVMKQDTHYGVIPGCDKPSLYKPGAEKLCLTFRLSPSFRVSVEALANLHRDYRVLCTLRHITTGAVLAEAEGSCSTMESKYRYRGGARKCPSCGKATIKVSKFPPRGAPAGTKAGFYCYAKIGGCGQEFAADDKTVAGQSEAKTEHPDIADVYNTCLKMAEKRSLVAAVLIATAASDIFTQDVEDLLAKEEAEAASSPAPAQRNGTRRAPIADRVRRPAPAPIDSQPVEDYGDLPSSDADEPPADEAPAFNRDRVMKALTEESVRGDVKRAAASFGLPLAKAGDIRAWSDTDLQRVYDAVFQPNPSA